MYNLNIDLIKALIICNFLALLAVSLLIIFLGRYKKSNEQPFLPVGNTTLLVMASYAACIVALTIVPLPFSRPQHNLRASINLEPVVNSVKSLLNTSKGRNHLLAMDTVENITGNIILFVPLGILLPFASRKFASYKKVCLVAFCCSVSIEITQLLSRLIHNYRQVDIDDVILNTLGAVAGFYLYEKWVGNKAEGALNKISGFN